MRLATLVALLPLGSLCFAEIRLPNVVGDHMLLQRDTPVRVFGKAQPGEKVAVTFRGQSAETVTPPLGRWEVWLKPMQPAPAANMTIRGNNTVDISDVLVGDGG